MRSRPPVDRSADVETLAQLETTNAWSLRELIDGCRTGGIDQIGLWRDLYEPDAVEDAGTAVAAASLTVTSLCRGGFFPCDDPDERTVRATDNVAAVDECVALGTNGSTRSPTCCSVAG